MTKVSPLLKNIHIFYLFPENTLTIKKYLAKIPSLQQRCQGSSAG